MSYELLGCASAGHADLLVTSFPTAWTTPLSETPHFSATISSQKNMILSL